ncbi:MAG: NUDIX domain-containing protein [Symbiopectobacterium sp.]
MACVVQAENHFLIVEEEVRGKTTWNQPVGHLKANETLMQAARRELLEETGISAKPQTFLRLHQCIAPDQIPFLRFCFVIDLTARLPTTPHNSDISCCHQLSAEEILHVTQFRSPLVAETIRCYQTTEHYPLSLVGVFNWHSEMPMRRISPCCPGNIMIKYTACFSC